MSAVHKYRRIAVAAVVFAIVAACGFRPPKSVDEHSTGAAGRNDNATLSVDTTRPGFGHEPGISTVSTEGNSLIVITTADQTTRVTEYSPAPGLSARELYEHLDEGVSSQPHPLAVGAAYNRCSYAYLGSAQTLCPMLHWSNTGRNVPIVYFVDHTSSRWPVRQSTVEWDRAPNIQIRYTQSDCPAWAHCINVWNSNYGNTCWQGMSTWSYYSNGNFVDNSVQIRLNDYNGTGVCSGRYVNYYKNAAGYRQNTCHEQGHALGLGHNSAYNSCMYAGITDSSALMAPDVDDLQLLGWLYSTPH